MRDPNKLEITTPSDREICFTRELDAPRELVFDAYTKPELLRRWLGVRGGWTFATCEIDLVVGGAYRFVWQRRTARMGVRGVYTEIRRPERVVSTELFDDPWYQGEAVSVVELVEHAGRTTFTMTLTYDSKKTRDSVLASPMETGLGEGFDVLDTVLAAHLRARDVR